MDRTRTAAAWLRMDDFTARWQRDNPATSLFCGAGCANCCSLAVHATLPEAVVVAAGLDRQDMANLERYVARLLAAAGALRDLPSYLRRHRQSLGPCPFLSRAQRCRIHGQRPLSCRALLATRPADWCGVDLAALDAWDKQLFQASLDRRLVAWPTHYVAATQDYGRALEQALLDDMLQRTGWTMSGNFPLLVWLERTRSLSTLETAAAAMAGLGLDASPLLAMTTGAPPRKG